MKKDETPEKIQLRKYKFSLMSSWSDWSALILESYEKGDYSYCFSIMRKGKVVIKFHGQVGDEPIFQSQDHYHAFKDSDSLAYIPPMGMQELSSNEPLSSWWRVN